MLSPVSFKKGRGHAPRLSEPYTPGRRHERFWTEEEESILHAHYADKGAAYCLLKLPHRNVSAIYLRARQLGLKSEGKTEKRQRVGTSLDARIKEAWPSLSGQGALTAFAASLGVRRHTVSQRAKFLGLTIPHKKEPAWTPEEDALLAKAPVNNPDKASAFFAAHGFRRTATAIAVRCKRRGISRRRKDVLSARAAAEILGIDSKVIAVWIADGILHGAPRGTKRLPQQRGEVWTITPAELCRFVLDNLERIDIRKVDKFAFVDLIANAGAP